MSEPDLQKASYRDVMNSFRDTVRYKFSESGFYSWLFGHAVIDGVDVPCIKMESYDRETPLQKLERHAINCAGIEGVRILLPQQGEKRAHIYVIGDLPRFMASLSDGFEEMGLKDTFMAHAGVLGYQPKDVANIVDEDRLMAHRMFAP